MHFAIDRIELRAPSGETDRRLPEIGYGPDSRGESLGAHVRGDMVVCTAQ